MLGTLAAYAAIITGDWFAESIPSDAPIQAVIEKHEMMASITATIFTIIALAYLFAWLQKEGVIEKCVARMLWTRPGVVILEKLDRLILCAPVSMILALVGVVAITMTGGLGAAMVYGPDIDPFVKIIYNLFF